MHVTLQTELLLSIEFVWPVKIFFTPTEVEQVEYNYVQIVTSLPNISQKEQVHLSAK